MGVHPLTCAHVGAELVDFLEKNQEAHVKTGTSDPSFGADFKFTTHIDELVIDGVFCRIYNEQPAYVITKPKSFVAAIVASLGVEATYLLTEQASGATGDAELTTPEKISAALDAFLTAEEGIPGMKQVTQHLSSEVSPEAVAECGEIISARLKQATADQAAGRSAPKAPVAETFAIRLKRTRTALESLRNVIKGNNGVEIGLKGHFKLLFSLLKYDEDSAMQMLVLEVIVAVIGNRECVNDIANSTVLVYLFHVIQTLPSGRALAIEAMHGLVSNPKIVVEALKYGGILYLLDMFCNSTSSQIREDTAALIGKIIADKLRGPISRITLTKFLPPIFMDAMQDSPEASVTTFESTHENPELIWNEESRSKVQSVVKECKNELFTLQSKDPTTSWELPPDFEVVYENVGDEVVVGGVFLNLLIKQPQWVFRKPKDFLVAAMEKYLKVLNDPKLGAKRDKDLEVITEALGCLFTAQPTLCALVPPLGHLPKLMLAMGRDHAETKASLLKVFNALVSADATIADMTRIGKCISLIKSAMSGCVRNALAAAMAMLATVFDSQPIPSSLVQQAVAAEFVQFLLEQLKNNLDTIEGAAAAKAHCVKAIKCMEKDLTHGSAVTEILAECPWWATYRSSSLSFPPSPHRPSFTDKPRKDACGGLSFLYSL